MKLHPTFGRRLRRRAAALVAACCVLAGHGASAQGVPHAPPPAEPAPIAHGLFSDLRVFRPAGTPTQFVLLLTAEARPTPREQQMLHALLADDAMVATVPFAPFYRKLAAQDGKCTYGPGAFENLARDLQAFEHLPGYLLPIVAGADEVSAYVYTLLAQAPAGTFEAGLSLGLRPRLVLKTPPCAGKTLRVQAAASAPAAASGAAVAIELAPAPTALASPWIAVQDDVREPAAATEAARSFVQAVPRAEWVALPADAAPGAALAAFDRAYRKLAVPQAELGAPPQQLSDLPIVELPVTVPGSRFAVLLSGDGGWAGIDKSLGTALAAQGVPVAGFDSLRYFWSARTPEELARDLDRVIRYYAARWGRSEVLLVGYSQGADVLPFAFNRLPAATRARVRLTALLGPGQKASFEFHLSNWIGPSGDRPIAPEALKLSAASTLCLYGQEETDSLCPELAPAHAQPVALAGGHHFGGEYGALAARILDAMPR